MSELLYYVDLYCTVVGYHINVIIAYSYTERRKRRQVHSISTGSYHAQTRFIVKQLCTIQWHNITQYACIVVWIFSEE